MNLSRRKFISIVGAFAGSLAVKCNIANASDRLIAKIPMTGTKYTPSNAIFSPDEKFLLIRSADLIRVWDLANLKQESHRFKVKLRTNYPHMIILNETNELVVSGEPSIKSYDFRSGKNVRNFFSGGYRNRQKISGELGLVAGRNSGSFRAFESGGYGNFSVVDFGGNSERGRIKKVVSGLDSSGKIFFSRDGKTVIWFNPGDSEVKSRDINSHRENPPIYGQVDGVYGVSVGYSGEYLLTSGSSSHKPEIALWTTKTGEEIFRIPFEESIQAIDRGFSPNGRIVLIGNPKISAFDLEQKREVAALDGHGHNNVFWASFSNSGDLVATCDGRLLNVWSLKGL